MRYLLVSPYLPPQTRVIQEVKSAQLLSYFFHSVVEHSMCDIYVLCVNASCIWNVFSRDNERMPSSFQRAESLQE